MEANKCKKIVGKRNRKHFCDLSYRQKMRLMVNELYSNSSSGIFQNDGIEVVKESLIDLNISASDSNHAQGLRNANYTDANRFQINKETTSIQTSSKTNEILSQEPSSGVLILNDMSLRTTFDLKIKLSKWVSNYNIPHTAANNLLTILKNCDTAQLSSLPQDARSLMKTPRKVNTMDIGGGKYVHFGLAEGIRQCIKENYITVPTEIKLNFNIDGLPLSKSSGSQFWPILAAPVEKFYVAPFPVGIFHGIKKPESVNEFLLPFVNEGKIILGEGGIFINNVLVKIIINCFICDAPAKAFISGVKNHTGYFGCTKCVVEGDFLENRVVFLELDCTSRTDESFATRHQPEHHREYSVLESLGIGMVSKIPLDYMHLVCLGVMKKLLQFWIKGKMNVRMKADLLTKTSEHLISLKPYITDEFARKPRNLYEIDRWKATELRQFLLYTGPVVLKGTLEKRFYKHFLCFHVAIRILADEEYCYILNDYAHSLLDYFVTQYKDLYGKHHVSYNVHNLIHIHTEVKLYGPLDNFSAFKYENYMQTLKKKVKHSSRPLEQVSNRIMESYSVNVKVTKKKYPSIIMRNNTVFGLEFSHFKLLLKPFENHCILKDGRICAVQNIIISDQIIQLKVKEYLSKTPFYTKPLTSLILGSAVVKDINTKWCIISSDDVYRKCLVLNISSDESLIMPLIHN